MNLTADELGAATRLIWGSRFSGGSEELAEFLGIRHRSALRLLSGEMAANERTSEAIRAELRRYLLHKDTPAARMIREALAVPAQVVR